MFEPRYPDHKNGSGRNRCRFQILPYLWIYPKRSDLLRHFALLWLTAAEKGGAVREDVRIAGWLRWTRPAVDRT